MLGIFARLKVAAGQAMAFFLVAGLAIAGGVWAWNNPDKFTAVVSSWGNAGAQIAVSTGDWVAAQAGGGSSAGQAAHAGPEIVWVENKAPARWPVGKAVTTWNRGLTSVKLKVGKCRDGAQCVKVSQGSVHTPAGESLVLGRESKFFGRMRVTFNAAAVGHVPASYFTFAACHELGHALGLEHRTAMTSCMHASAKGAAVRPDRTDFAKVNAEYGH